METGLMAHILPEVLEIIGCEQPPEWHPEGDVYTHTCIMLEMLADDAPLELCLAVLLHDIAKPPCQTFDDRIRFNGHDAMGAEMAEAILRRLRYPNDVIDAVVPMVARHMQFMNVQADAHREAEALHGRADLLRRKWSCTASIADRRTASRTTTSFSRPRRRNSPPSR